MFEDEDFCFDENLFEEEEFEDYNEYTGEAIDFNKFDNSIDFSNDEYCKTECEFFKTCCANHDVCIKEAFNHMLKTLTPREEKVLKMRFGWYNGAKFSLSQTGVELNHTRERIRQIEAKALRKSRHPSRSKKIHPFLYDIILLPNENFYKALSLAIFGEFGNNLGFEAELGIDYNIVDKDKTSHKSINEIRSELARNIHDIEYLRPFVIYLDSSNITTLNHLLHTSESKLLVCFEKDDKKLFDLLKVLSDKGYQLKETCTCASKLNEHYAKDLKNFLFDTSVFQERFLDLPSKIVFKLFEQGITTNDDLLIRISFVKSLQEINSEEQKIIDDYLATKNLLCYLDESHSKKIYISSILFDTFINNLIAWFKNNCVSILSFKNNLSKFQNISIVSLFELIKTQYSEFKYNNIIDFLSITDFDITELDLSLRTYNALSKAGIHTLQDIVSLSNASLSKIKLLTPKGINEINEKLSLFGLRPQDEV